MNRCYDDIINKMGEPKWYDALGYPRYCNFHPSKTSDIYAEFVAYTKINCQACGKPFFVAQSFSVSNMIYNQDFKDFAADRTGAISKLFMDYIKQLSVADFSWLLHYGDPPYHNCVGDSMNCDDIELLEFWRRPDFSWQRDRSFERMLVDSLRIK